MWKGSSMLRTPTAGSTNGILYNYTSTAGFTAVFDKQFQYTLSFNDASGSPLSPAPTAVTLSAQTSGGTTTITQYTGFLSNDIYTVTGASWEGWTIGTTSPGTLDLTAGLQPKPIHSQAT